MSDESCHYVCPTLAVGYLALSNIGYDDIGSSLIVDRRGAPRVYGAAPPHRVFRSFASSRMVQAIRFDEDDATLCSTQHSPNF